MQEFQTVIAIAAILTLGVPATTFALTLMGMALGWVKDNWPKGDSLGRAVDFWTLWEPEDDDTNLNWTVSVRKDS